MEADERDEAAACKRQRREECRRMAQEVRQKALKHTQKLETGAWGPTCKERKKLWKEELTSLMMLVGVVATLMSLPPARGQSS